LYSETQVTNVLYREKNIPGGGHKVIQMDGPYPDLPDQMLGYVPKQMEIRWDGDKICVIYMIAWIDKRREAHNCDG